MGEVSDTLVAVREILDVTDPSAITITPRRDLTSGAHGRLFFEASSVGARFLVKVGAKSKGFSYELATALSELSPPCYRSPRFYGRIDTTEVWEYVTGTTKSLRIYTRAELDTLLRSIAAVEASLDHPDLPQTFWIKPVAKRLEAAAETSEGLRPFVSHIRKFARWESRLLQQAFVPCLTHNDLHSHNIILTDAQICLIDWESASFGPPGATLRVFSDWSLSQKRGIAVRYAQYRKRFGFPVDIPDVMFAMHAHQMFWAFHTAVRQDKADRFRQGWRHFGEILKGMGSSTE
jgi:thiamine kinase-like enzyme